MFSILLGDLPFCLEFLVLVGPDKIMNGIGIFSWPKKKITKKLHLQVHCTILVDPTKIATTKTITQRPFCLGQAKIALLDSEDEKMNIKSHINNAKSNNV